MYITLVPDIYRHLLFMSNYIKVDNNGLLKLMQIHISSILKYFGSFQIGVKTSDIDTESQLLHNDH